MLKIYLAPICHISDPFRGRAGRGHAAAAEVAAGSGFCLAGAMSDDRVLMKRLRAAGFAASSVRTASGGAVALAGLATLEDGSRVFAKTLRDLDPEAFELFEVEAAGLTQLREAGGVSTPPIRLASAELLVLEEMQPRPDGEAFWERLGHMLAALHTTTVSDRFGWHREGWLGRMRQENAWTDDGHEFFAHRRILRWLPEPLAESAFDADDRHAIEALCAALPDLIPARPPSLTHGDLWSENILATPDGAPVLIDPATSYTWPEVDLSMLWCSPRPPASERFFAAYREAAPLDDGWEARMPVLYLRELLSAIAHGDDSWGAVGYVREVIAPFRRRPAPARSNPRKASGR
ncbi:fructosamine kinase family protein [Actinospica robiniae]|uniref:fructosamine kinase family protein n=1 Tax=Actinospica robiniae TaxID=304901 RepID=UPI001B7F7A69|nr:fructosamine kinase family protein [Actinospica robiniae]